MIFINNFRYPVLIGKQLINLIEFDCKTHFVLGIIVLLGLIGGDRMNEDELIGIISEKFKDDPLWEQINMSDLTDYLFPNDLMNKLNVTTTYSLSQAAEILKVRDHNLRNYLNRHDLIDYIKPERAGKLYRLDYRCVFKFHMIFILVNHGKRTPTDIASYAGTVVEVGHTTARPSFREAPVNDQRGVTSDNHFSDMGKLQKRMEVLEKSMFILNWERLIDQSKNELEKSLRYIENWEKEIALLGQEIESIELKKQLKRQEKKTQELIKESHKAVAPEYRQVGILKSIFGKAKQSNIDYDKVIDKAAKEVDTHIRPSTEITKLDEQLSVLRSKLDDLHSKKDDLFKNKNEKESRLKKSQGELEAFKLENNLVQKASTLTSVANAGSD